MYFNRTGRILVCLLLVCCLLVTCPPVQAYAMSPGVAAAIIIGVPAALVIGSSLIGQGILPGIGDAFNNLINDIKMSVAVQRFIYDDKIDVLASTNTATDETQYYVSQDVLEAVQEAAFETGAISVSDAFPPLISAGEWAMGGNTYIKAPVDAYAFAIYPSAGYTSLYLCLASTVPFDSFTIGFWQGTSPEIHSTYTYTYNDLTIYYGYIGVSSSNWTDSIGVVYNGNTGWYIAQVLSGEIPYGDSKITLADGLVQGAVVGSNAISFPEAYPDWADKSIEQDDPDNPIPFFPIGLGNTYEETISKSQEDVWNGISEYTAAVLDNWTSLLGAISAIKTFVGSIATSIGSWFENVISEIGAFAASVSTWFENVISKIEELPSKFAEWFNSIIEKLSFIWETLKTIPQTILDGLRNILTELFVPQADYISDKVTSLRERFSFADSIMETGRAIGDSLSFGGSEPPVIYIHLGDTEGSYNIGGTVPFLDMRWYARYKPTGDVLLSSLIWVFFAWRCFVHAPNIISGIAGDVEAFNIPDGGGMYLSGSSFAGSDFEKPKRGKFERRKNGRR